MKAVYAEEAFTQDGAGVDEGTILTADVIGGYVVVTIHPEHSDEIRLSLSHDDAMLFKEIVWDAATALKKEDQ